MKVLGVAVLLVAVAYWWLSTRHDPGVDPVALGVVTAVGVVTTVALVGMFAFTRGWTIRATGLLLLLAGVAVYGLGTFALVRGWLPVSSAKPVNDLILAVWMVGAPALAYGLAKMFWEQRGGAR